VSDSTSFQTSTQQICRRYRSMAQGFEPITWVFDKYNISSEAIETLDGSTFHFNGSMVMIISWRASCGASMPAYKKPGASSTNCSKASGGGNRAGSSAAKPPRLPPSHTAGGYHFERPVPEKPLALLGS
jgi:hypothetical protein